MLYLLLGAFLLVSVQAEALVGSPCTKEGVFPLVDNTPEFYACDHAKSGGFTLRYLRCQDGEVFRADLDKCVSIEARDSGGDIENPTVPPASPNPDTNDSTQNFEESSSPTTDDGSSSAITDGDSSSASTDDGSSSVVTDGDSSSASTDDGSSSAVTDGDSSSASTDDGSSSASTDGDSSSASTDDGSSSVVTDGDSSSASTDDGSSSASTDGDSSSASTDDGSSSASTDGDSSSASTNDGSSSASTDGDSSSASTNDGSSSASTDGDSSSASTDDGSSSASTASTPSTTSSSGICATSGFLPKSGACDQYVYCYEDEETGDLTELTMKCPGTMQFDPSEKFCSVDYDCTGGANNAKGRLNELANEFSCEVEGSFANTNDCHQYYACSWNMLANGFAVTLKSCPSGKAYDERTGKCALEQLVDSCKQH